MSEGFGTPICLKAGNAGLIFLRFVRAACPLNGLLTKRYCMDTTQLKVMCEYSLILMHRKR